MNLSDKEILERRAKDLSSVEKNNQDEFSGYFLLFDLSDKSKYAIHFDYIDRVVSGVLVTDVPFSPECISGIVYSEGEVLSAVNIKAILEKNSDHNRMYDYMIIVECSNNKVGFLVDNIIGLESYNKQESLVVPSAQSDVGLKWIEGIYRSDIAVINVVSLMSNLDAGSWVAL